MGILRLITPGDHTYVIRKLIKLDAARVSRATARAAALQRETIQRIARLEADESVEKREQQGLCRTCFYLRTPRLGSAAITQQPCGLCEDLQTYSSTATDILCLPCALEHALCKQCGADRNLNNGRHFHPIKV